MDPKSFMKTRSQFLKMLYEATDGKIEKEVNKYDIAAALYLGRQSLNNTIDYLAYEGLLKKDTTISVSITLRGIMEIEKATTDPEKSTEGFLH